MAVRLDPEGVLIDADVAGQFVMEPPRLMMRSDDYDGRKPAFAVENPTRAIARYPGGGEMRITINGLRIDYAFYGFPAGAHRLRLTTLIPITFAQGGAFVLSPGAVSEKLPPAMPAASDFRPFPASRNTQNIAQANGRRLVFRDPADAGFSVTTPHGFQELQDNRVFNWPVFAWIFNYRFDEHPGENGFSIELVPFRSPVQPATPKSFHPDTPLGAPVKLEREKLKLTFEEDFRAPVDFYNPVNDSGRWKTNYWFGWQQGASSRTYATAKEIMVDEAYAGINPFSQDGHSMAIHVNPASVGDPRMDGKRYTGGILTTEKSFAQRYGFFEARIAMPEPPGFWPAFWLWSRQGPGSLGNEIDIVECQTASRTKTWHSLHLRARPGADGQPAPVLEKPDTVEVAADDITESHTYGLLWTPEEIVWFVDGNEAARRPNPGFHDEMFLILSVGVGGWEPGNALPEKFPGRMRIHFVRVYQLR